MSPLRSLCGLAVALAACAAQATPVIGSPVDLFAAQSAVTAVGHDRFDTEFVFQEADLAPLLGASARDFSTGPLRATGSTVEVRYVGTLAAHAGQLFLQGAGALFSTRSGLDAAAAAADFSSYIDTIGTARTITGLNAFDALVFGLQAEAFGGDTSLGLAGNAAAQVLAEGSGAVRALELGPQRWLLGFETFGALDYADALMVVSGVSFTAPPVQGLPVPGSLGLALLGLGALALRPRRPGTGA